VKIMTQRNQIPPSKAGRVRRLTAAGLAVLLIAGAACGSPRKTNPQTLLNDAKAKLDATSSAHFKLSSTGVGTSSNNIVGGEGDLARPDQVQGTFAVTVGGFTANVKIITKNGEFYAQLPFQSHYQKTNPADFGLTNPAELMSPTNGLSQLLVVGNNATMGKSERINGELLYTVNYSVPGSAIPVLPDAKPSAPVAVVAAINPSNYELRQIQLTGPLTSATSNSTYTLTLTKYNEPVNITLPQSS
jgi:lipoprotein LprG